MSSIADSTIAESSFSTPLSTHFSTPSEEDFESDRRLNYSDPLTPSFTASDLIPTSKASPKWDLSSSEFPIYDDQPIMGSDSSCMCLQTQADQLCQLHVVEKRYYVLQMDTILHQAIRGLQTSQNILQCSTCWNDPQVLQLTVMVLRAAFRLAEQLSRAESISSNTPTLMLNNYEVSNDWESLVKNTLLPRLLGHSKITLSLLQISLEQIAQDTQMDEQHDMEYLHGACRTLTQTLMALSSDSHNSRFHDYINVR